MKAYAALSKAFVDQGIETLFGVMGDGNMMYIAAFEAEFGGRFIGSVDERGAVSMADGFARATGNVGVVTVTHGPGLTNALTSLVEAVQAKTPMVLLTADTPGGARRHLQQVDREGFVRPTGAAFQRARRAQDVVEEFGRALQQASLEQRPVVLDIPVDHMQVEIDDRPSLHQRVSLPGVPPSQAALDSALGMLASARNPMILAGRGAVMSDAKSSLLRLAELCQAPVATTVPAKNFFAGHPLNLGICGTLAHSVAIDAISRSDVVVAFGASLNDKTTDGGALLRGKAVIQCDIDPTRFNMFEHASALVQGDAEATALAMTEMLEAADFHATPHHEELAEQLASRRDVDDFTDLGSPGKLDGRSAAIHLNNVMPRERAIVSDAGRFLQATWRYLDPIDARAHVTTNNFGSIGLGMATAVGFAAARPDLLTVAVLGDGGGMMGIKEFTTAVRNNLRLAVLVFNDESYGAEYSKLQEFGLDPKYSLANWPRFSDLGKAMGGRGIRVESLEEIDALPPETWATENLPVIIEVMMDPAIDLYL